MNFKEYIIQEEVYTSSIIGEIRKLFPDRRFAMFHASGSSEFIGYDRDVYEIRVETERYASPYTPGRSPNGKAFEILEKIKDSNVLDATRDVAGEPAFVGKYSPTRDSTTQMNHWENYKITVVNWKNSPYQQTFLNSKMRPHEVPTRMAG